MGSGTKIREVQSCKSSYKSSENYTSLTAKSSFLSLIDLVIYFLEINGVLSKHNTLRQCCRVHAGSVGLCRQIEYPPF